MLLPQNIAASADGFSAARLRKNRRTAYALLRGFRPRTAQNPRHIRQASLRPHFRPDHFTQPELRNRPLRRMRPPCRFSVAELAAHHVFWFSGFQDALRTIATGGRP